MRCAVYRLRTPMRRATATSYFAASVATFAIVMDVALLLTGIGFIVVASGLIGSTAMRRPQVSATKPIKPAAAH